MVTIRYDERRARYGITEQRHCLMLVLLRADAMRGDATLMMLRYARAQHY